MPNAIFVSRRRGPAAGPAPGGSRRDAAVARWIASTLRADPPRARSLIVTVWGDALSPHGGELWLAALIAVMAPLGVNERSVRTGVFRLAADGWLAGAAHGRRSRYHLTRSGARAFADAYQRIYTPHDGAWDGRWQVALAHPESLSPAQRAALRSALAWAGFAALAPGVHARPLAALGDRLPLDARTRAHLTVITARDDDARGAPLARAVPRQLGLAAVASRYRRFLRRFGPAIELFRGRAHAPDAQQCFVARTLLIHAYRRVLLADPLLPASLLPAAWPGAAAYALTRDFYRCVVGPADRWLADAVGDDFGAPGEAYARRFGGLD